MYMHQHILNDLCLTSLSLLPYAQEVEDDEEPDNNARRLVVAFFAYDFFVADQVHLSIRQLRTVQQRERGGAANPAAHRY